MQQTVDYHRSVGCLDQESNGLRMLNDPDVSMGLNNLVSPNEETLY
jgi:hypothetical protein